MLSQLFQVMKTGSYFRADKILYFNGGLFDDDRVLPLNGYYITEIKIQSQFFVSPLF